MVAGEADTCITVADASNTRLLSQNPSERYLSGAGSEKVSFEGIFAPTSLSGRQSLFSSSNFGSSLGVFNVAINTDGSATFEFLDNNSNEAQFSSDAGLVEAGVPAHIGVAYQYGVLSSVLLSVNGQAFTTANRSWTNGGNGNSSRTASSYWYLFRRYDSALQYYIGKAQHIAYYRRLVTAAEFQARAALISPA